MRPLQSFPTKTHPLIFETWITQNSLFSPFEFVVNHSWVTIKVRLGHRIFKWEYLRLKARNR